MAYRREMDLRSGIVRIFNTYGPRMRADDGRVVTNFIIAELAEIVVDMVGSDSPIEYHDLPVDDPTRRRPDITLAQAELGWSPSIPLADGLRRTADYFLGNE